MYLNMELVLPQGDSLEPRMARVTKRLKDANGIPIGTADDNPLLDTRMYEVEYLDGECASLSANHIAENLFAQVDDEGNRQVLMKEIIDYHTNGQEVKHQDAFIMARSGTKRRRETTKGWEILIEWKDGSTNWVALKDVKESYPVQLAEFTISNCIAGEPAFAWWVPFVMKKRNRILAKVKSKYWLRSQKFGIRIPKSVEEAKKVDNQNGNTLWWEAICKKMHNVRPADTFLSMFRLCSCGTKPQRSENHHFVMTSSWEHHHENPKNHGKTQVFLVWGSQTKIPLL